MLSAFMLILESIVTLVHILRIRNMKYMPVLLSLSLHLCTQHLNKTEINTHRHTYIDVQALDPISYAIIICAFCRIVCLMLLLDKRWFLLSLSYSFFFAELFPSRSVDLYRLNYC